MIVVEVLLHGKSPRVAEQFEERLRKVTNCTPVWLRGSDEVVQI